MIANCARTKTILGRIRWAALAPALAVRIFGLFPTECGGIRLFPPLLRATSAWLNRYFLNVLVENVDRPKTNTIRNQLALADQIPDSEMRGRVRSLLKQEYAQDAAIYKDAYNDLKFQIYNMYAAGTVITSSGNAI